MGLVGRGRRGPGEYLFRNLPSRGTSFPTLDSPAAAGPLGAGFHVFLYTHEILLAYCSMMAAKPFFSSPRMPWYEVDGGEERRGRKEGRKGAEGNVLSLLPLFV